VTSFLKPGGGVRPWKSSSNGKRPDYPSALIRTGAAKGVTSGSVSVESTLLPSSSIEIAKCAKRIKLGPEESKPADASNFGNRDSLDFQGNPISNVPALIVLHETVMDERDTINLFKTNHPNDQDQTSYHMLVARDGQLVRIVPDTNRAFGAGMSHFHGQTFRTKAKSLGSINNVALHISLVSPGDNQTSDAHSGYTELQYKSLASQVLLWQMKYGIPMSRVTTHYAVDRSHSRYDPRSFHWDVFDNIHRNLAAECGVIELSQPL